MGYMAILLTVVLSKSKRLVLPGARRRNEITQPLIRIVLIKPQTLYCMKFSTLAGHRLAVQHRLKMLLSVDTTLVPSNSFRKSIRRVSFTMALLLIAFVQTGLAAAITGRVTD